MRTETIQVQKEGRKESVLTNFYPFDWEGANSTDCLRIPENTSRIHLLLDTKKSVVGLCSVLQKIGLSWCEIRINVV